MKCEDLLWQCNDFRPGEAQHIITKARWITTMFKQCDEFARRKTTTSTTKRVREKRSEASDLDEEQDDNDRYGEGSLKHFKKFKIKHLVSPTLKKWDQILSGIIGIKCSKPLIVLEEGRRRKGLSTGV